MIMKTIPIEELPPHFPDFLEDDDFDFYPDGFIFVLGLVAFLILAAAVAAIIGVFLFLV